MTKSTLGAACILPAIAVAFAASCSGTSPEGSEFAGGRQDAGAQQDAATGGGEDVTVGDEKPDDAGFGALDTSFTGDGALNKDGACAATHVEAEEIPLDLFIMADRSVSMDGTRWSEQSTALNAFFTDPKSEGLWIALSFFPFDGSCTSPNSTCNGDYYYKPQVQWGLLPGHASTLAATIAATEPDGCTPTQAALNGVLRGALDRQNAYHDHVVAAVIVSDGDPCCSMCPIEEAGGLGQIAAQYANGSPPIKTFSIYVASSASTVMAAIATGGGTVQAYDAVSGTQSFISALDDIRSSLIACEYKVPVPEAGTINPEVIEVEYTPGTGVTETIGRVKHPQECGTGEGWQYDDDSNPTRITLCPATCDRVQGDEDGQVDILVGCESSQR